MQLLYWNSILCRGLLGNKICKFTSGRKNLVYSEIVRRKRSNANAQMPSVAKANADDSLILHCASFLFERREISYPLLITRDTLTLHVMDEFRSLSNQSINGYLPMDV